MKKLHNLREVVATAGNIQVKSLKLHPFKERPWTNEATASTDKRLVTTTKL